MQCNRCGAALPPGVATCPNCGNPTPYNITSPSGQGSYDPTVAASPPYGSTPGGGTPMPPTGYGAPSYGTPPESNPYSSAGTNPYETPPQPPPYGGTPSQPPYGGTPSQPGYIAPGQPGGYGMTGQPGGYGAYPGGPGQPPPKKRGNRVLLIVGIVLLVLLVACISGVVILARLGSSALTSAQATVTAVAATDTASQSSTPTANAATPTTDTTTPTTTTQNGPSPSGSPIVPSAAAIITNLQMASAVNGTSPTKLTTQFAPKQTVYATFKLSGQAGYAVAKWYLDGVYGFSSDVLQVKSGNDQGYFSAYFNRGGQAAVEIYWCTQAACSDAQLGQVVTFTITATGSINTQDPNQLAIIDIDNRH